jgi:hypothetical protein
MVRGSDSAKMRVWRERLERFAKSDMKVKQFCTGEGVSVASFYDWRRKLENPSAGRDGQEDCDLEPSHLSGRTSRVFAPIVVSPVPMPVSIRLPDGVQIDVPSENLAAVRTVIGELLQTDLVPGKGTAAC